MRTVNGQELSAAIRPFTMSCNPIRNKPLMA
jgi:hypothetical protein